MNELFGSSGGEQAFLSPYEYRYNEQYRHFGPVRTLLQTFVQRQEDSDSEAVRVVRPARFFARDTLRATIPNQPTSRWITEPDHSGWILRGVANPRRTSASMELGPILLLDDLRYMAPDIVTQWGQTEGELYVPATYLEPLTPNAPVRMERVRIELEALLT